MRKTFDYPLASNILRLQNYLLPPDEAVFLDWLLVKYMTFDFKPFFYSYRRITEELRIKRTRLDAIIEKFERFGLLLFETKGSAEARGKISCFTVIPSKIRESLSSIISLDSPNYFRMWEEFISLLENSSNKEINLKTKH